MNNIPGTITLDEHYYIDVDALNWILKEVKIIPPTDRRGKPNKNAGNHCDVVIGYYPKLDKALEAYSDMITKDTVMNSATAINVRSMIIQLQAIKNAITKLSLTLNVKQEDKAE